MTYHLDLWHSGSLSDVEQGHSTTIQFIAKTTSIYWPGQPGLTGTRKVNHSGFQWSKRWWGGSGISQTIWKSFSPRFRQITIPVPNHSIFYRLDALPATQPTALKHWRHKFIAKNGSEIAKTSSSNVTEKWIWIPLCNTSCEWLMWPLVLR